MKGRYLGVILVLVTIILSAYCLKSSPMMNPMFFQATPMTEEQKIDHLINYVRNLKDAKFIRNGNAHSPSKAADHLLGKKVRNKSEYTSAMEFIEVAATKSSAGNYYMVQHPDGKEQTLASLLRAELKRIEGR